MKENKISILFYIASVLFYLAAIIGFLSNNSNSMVIIWLLLGCEFLCLGTVYKKKITEDSDDNDCK